MGLVTNIDTTPGTYTRLKANRVALAKQSYVTRRASLKSFHYLVTGAVTPQPGQLVLARVDQIGQHTRLELPSGRKANLFVGDEIIVSFGNRYAPDQFLAEVPENLSACHLVAAGGLAAKSIAKHARVRGATKITPLGLIADRQKRIINLRRYRLPVPTFATQMPLVLAVAGSSMNGGKTTTVANLVKGLRLAGLSVAAAKTTGTGSGGGTWKMLDAGAYPVVDFTDFGHASTYKLSSEQTVDLLQDQINFLASHDTDVIILELADGLVQEETRNLLESQVFARYVDGIFFAAAEALSASHGVQWLASRNLPVVAISGALTASPLSLIEAQGLCEQPVLGTNDLINENIYQLILDRLQQDKLSQHSL